MNKSIHFTGQPTFSQLIKLIPKEIISSVTKSYSADRYYKKFNTWHHLVTMLFGCYGNCSSLREVVIGMRALEGRLLSSGIKHLPARSTFAEANEKRSAEVFEQIYLSLKGYWDAFLPDSRNSTNQLYVIDSNCDHPFSRNF